jgi:peptidoglycan/xylan/chitin deacetylase (PgdA/CDA1 family)
MKTVNPPQRALIMIVLLFVSLFTGCDKQSDGDKQINVVFRFDDYSAVSMTSTELEIIDIFRKNQASVTFGVIPFVCAGEVNDPSPQEIIPLTASKGDILKSGIEEGILDIAMHGYSHQTIDVEPLTEFSTLEYNIQLDKITKGKKLLEDILEVPLNTFIPPWDQYDINTLHALEEAGFSTISADRKGSALDDTKLNFLPATCGLTHLRSAIKAARASSDNQPLIVVIFQEYDFKDLNEETGITTYHEFDDILNWLKTQKDIRILTIHQATEEIQDLSADRYLLTKQNYLLERFLPVALGGSVLIYHESPIFLKTLLKVGLSYIVIIIFGAVLFLLIGYLVFPRVDLLVIKIVTFGIIVISAIILLYKIYDLRPHSTDLAIGAAAIGASIGIYICFRSVKKRISVQSNGVT